ncbi:hypothetical protein DAPPUDRAFT_104638 [Daphnia pulex]|uniref:Uncharacterized protein n=1 Tax=Daphnia pulex TaxID=6669 RepID=E9GMV6_DAPPU|nr:hypothetical protein DAPPUDRAFT_104638 [Daphnia pulex]|eukprot:EFX79159.1 hypothetical protein DAPPUDRAFT_104638 [Daphnia pulex]
MRRRRRVPCILKPDYQPITNQNIFSNTFKVHNILNNAEPAELQEKLPLPLQDLALSVKQKFPGQNNTFGPGNLIPGVGTFTWFSFNGLLNVSINSECSQEGHELIVRRVPKETNRGQECLWNVYSVSQVAVAEMANCLQRRNRQWATHSEDLLKEEMKALGLPISTDILKPVHRFPLEAGLSPAHFTILDEIETQSLKKIQDTVFHEADIGKDPVAKQQSLIELTNLLKRQRVFEVSKAILHLTLAIHRRYQRLKGERAFLDYDSLITFAIGLLHSPQGVFYNLAIPKKSIYIFQGDDLAAFSFMLNYIQERYFKGPFEKCV